MFGKKLSDEAKEKIKIAQTRRIKSSEEKYKIRKSKLGKQLSKSSKEKLSKANKGKILSEFTKVKISNSLKNKEKPKITCKYCGKIVDICNHKRWHDINCKSRTK